MTVTTKRLSIDGFARQYEPTPFDTEKRLPHERRAVNDNLKKEYWPAWSEAVAGRLIDGEDSKNLNQVALWLMQNIRELSGVLNSVPPSIHNGENQDGCWGYDAHIELGPTPEALISLWTGRKITTDDIKTSHKDIETWPRGIVTTRNNAEIGPLHEVGHLVFDIQNRIVTFKAGPSRRLAVRDKTRGNKGERKGPRTDSKRQSFRTFPYSFDPALDFDGSDDRSTTQANPALFALEGAGDEHLSKVESAEQELAEYRLIMTRLPFEALQNAAMGDRLGGSSGDKRAIARSKALIKSAVVAFYEHVVSRYPAVERKAA